MLIGSKSNCQRQFIVRGKESYNRNNSYVYIFSGPFYGHEVSRYVGTGAGLGRSHATHNTPGTSALHTRVSSKHQPQDFKTPFTLKNA